MQLNNLLLTIPLTLLVSACGAMTSYTSVDKIHSNVFYSNNVGVVILSTGAMKRCSFGATFTTYLVLYDSRNNRPFPNRASVDHSNYKSDFETHHGLVHAFVLEPGRYFFSPQHPEFRGDGTKESFDTFGFEVEGGETTYLGEFWLHKNCVSPNPYAIYDKYERDLAVAKTQNPYLAQREVVKRFMQLTGQITRED